MSAGPSWKELRSPRNTRRREGDGRAAPQHERRGDGEEEANIPMQRFTLTGERV